MFAGKKALLLDMNGTFMFGEDRFGPTEDFSLYYSAIGGKLSRSTINGLIRRMYDYLSVRYSDERYRHCFLSTEQALQAIADHTLEDDEIQRIVATFAHHELGYVPAAYANALRTLKECFMLGAVIDIWSPKAVWLQALQESGIESLFAGISFSSDHGMVKPSPKPFELVLRQLNLPKTQAIVVGDSLRRDLGGAKNAGIDCILVGAVTHPDAFGHCSNLLELSELIRSEVLLMQGR